ncbi:DUF2059 domain-containing protein [Hufsiella ginkgonis]|uniref:DUF2059 domain-containing protein n=1 Tax=Hufsiella ginkgonis TaxID=2695274 RepID=A0A7K1XUF2_9SPHI|nr:DUF2059 domain-containing protein [Hufsiella ginkgonis]MXV14641.1 DUF2059 domain-containing protein [Hufsiella ginkgonis]
MFLASHAQQKSSHYRAAEELVTAMKLQANFKSTIDAAVSAQTAAIPEMQRQKFTAAMREFLEKYATWEKMKQAYVDIYMEEFTEGELKDISRFYQTPSGRKFIDKATILSSRSIQVGQKLVKDHPKEMQAIIAKYFN